MAIPTPPRSLSDLQRNKLKYYLQKDLAITRGMIYNNLQEWKRTVYEGEAGQDLNVAATAYDSMRLTKADIDFINGELEKIMFWEIPDTILYRYAEITLADLSKQNRLSQPQQQLKNDLQEALTPGKTDEIPF